MKSHAKGETPSVESYIDNYCDRFLEFTDLVTHELKSYEPKLFVDCANGLTALQITRVKERIGAKLAIVVINKSYELPNKLNALCGPEHILKSKKADSAIADHCKTASFDGDGDRMIYYKPVDKKAVVSNGDKIVAFVMNYIVEKLEMCRIRNQVTHCLVYNPYMNGNCVKFLESNEVNTFLVPFGVSHLAKEVKKYTIGAGCDFSGHSIFHVDWETLDRAL